MEIRRITSQGMVILFTQDPDTKQLSAKEESSGEDLEAFLTRPGNADLATTDHINEISTLVRGIWKAFEAATATEASTMVNTELPTLSRSNQQWVDSWDEDFWTTSSGVTLSQEQRNAVILILFGDNTSVFLTGGAGTGKSVVVSWLKENEFASVCAPTGIAALNVGGCTVDNMFALDRARMECFNTNVLERNMQGSHQRIIIDEASMIGDRMAEYIYKTALAYNKTIILVGDMAQAKPVKEEWGNTTDLFRQSSFFKLVENHRQSESERVFLKALNECRIGSPSEQTAEVFKTRVCPRPAHTEGVIVFEATNRAVDGHNQTQLRKHCKESGALAFRLTSTFTDLRPDGTQLRYPRNGAFKHKAIEMSPFQNKELALGAQVVITRNSTKISGMSGGGSYVNGDTGILEDCHLEIPPDDLRKYLGADHPLVQARCRTSPLSLQGRIMQPEEGDLELWFSALSLQDQQALADSAYFGSWVRGLRVRKFRSAKRTYVPKHSVVSRTPRKEDDYMISGIPVKLGWSITIHKSQGLTVDEAWINMDSIRQMPGGSRHGLAYVALSRVRTLDGLHLSSWDPDVIHCEPAVRHFI